MYVAFIATIVFEISQRYITRGESPRTTHSQMYDSFSHAHVDGMADFVYIFESAAKMKDISAMLRALMLNDDPRVDYGRGARGARELKEGRNMQELWPTTRAAHRNLLEKAR